MRLLAPTFSLAALALTACAVQTPQEQLAPASPTVRLCEGNNCSELPRNVATFRGEPVNPEAERRLAALVQKAEADPRAAYDLGLRYLRGDGVERNSYQAIEWMRKAGDAGNGQAQFALLPQAQAAKQNAHARYQAIEDERKSWNGWYVGAPYYMVWGSSGWYYR